MRHQIRYVWILLTAGLSTSLGASQLPQRPALRVVPLTGSGDPCKNDQVVPQLLNVDVNQTPTRTEYLFLMRPCGGVLAAVDDLEEMRIITDGRPTVLYEGRKYLLLNSFPGLTFKLKENAQKIALDGAPYIFRRTFVNLDPRPVRAPDPVGNGAFLNYVYLLSGTRGGDRPAVNQNYDLGFFGRWGTLGHRFVIVDPSTKAAFGRRLVRSNTTYEYQFINENSTLRIGDIFASTGTWGTGNFLAGFQYASNFTLQPNRGVLPVTQFDFELRRRASIGLNSYPLWIDSPQRRYYETLAQQENFNISNPVGVAPHGPVTLMNIPNTIDNRELNLQYRQFTGETFSSFKPDYFGRRLLRAGISDFSYEFGINRSSFFSDTYGGFAASATHRYGLTQFFTIEGHGEYQQSRQALGGSFSWAVPYVGALSAVVARSRIPNGPQGFLNVVTVENTVGNVGYQFGYRRTDRSFRLPGNTLDNRSVINAGLGFPFLGGQLSLGHSRQNFHQAINGVSKQSQRTVAYNRPLPLGMQLFFLVSQTQRLERDQSVNAFINIPFSIFTSGGASGNGQIDYSKNQGQDYRARASASYNFNAGDNPIGVFASQGISNPEESSLGVNWAGSRLAGNVGINRVGELYSYAANINGSLAYIANKFFLTRNLGDSFGLLRLGKNYAGTRVNGLVTDDEGDVLVPNLSPYHENTVALDFRDFSLGAQPENTFFRIVSHFRAGNIIQPSIKAKRDVLLTLKVKDGKDLVFLPVGAYAKVSDSEENFPVGDEGLLYIYGVSDTFKLTVRFRGEQCVLNISLPPVKQGEDFQETPELAPLVCEGITL